MQRLDSLNKLYVAMTRPKERLYIFSKSLPDKMPNDFQKKGDLNSFLYAYGTHFPIIVGDADMMHVSKVKNRILDLRELNSRNFINITQAVLDDFESQLEIVLKKINNDSFVQTTELKHCEWCDYKMICKR